MRVECAFDVQCGQAFTLSSIKSFPYASNTLSILFLLKSFCIQFTSSTGLKTIYVVLIHEQYITIPEMNKVAVCKQIRINPEMKKAVAHVQ